MPGPPPFVIPPGGVSAGSLFTGTAIVDPAQPPGILADAIDPLTGEYVSIFVGLDPIDAHVLHQVSVRRGSGGAVNGGQAFDTIEQNDSTAEGRARFEMARITEPMVKLGWIEIVRLSITAGEDAGDQGDLLLEYRNRATGKVEKAVA